MEGYDNLWKEPMMETGLPVLQRTPLYDAHRRLGARFAPFAGWEMPVEYTGILDEHRAVRERAGLFDVSHMGQIEVNGEGSPDFVQWLITNDAARLEVGDALYSPICRPDGGILDDLLVFRAGPRRYRFIVNAANRRKDLSWFGRVADAFPGVMVRDLSQQFGAVALQGPRAAAILGRFPGMDVGDLRGFTLREGVTLGGVRCIVARTGYTGEDGFELFAPVEGLERLWEAILRVGEGEGLRPAGLGARDMLRLEAALPLYGQDLTEDLNPFEVRLARFVSLDKGEFIGRDALVRASREGVRRSLIGLVARDRGVPRHGYEVLMKGVVVGRVTSGGHSPVLGTGIALALVEGEGVPAGTEMAIAVRGRPMAAEVVKLPFYRRKRGD